MNITLDLNSLDRNTIETFEIMAAYTVSLYHNYLYIEAVTSKKNKTVSSITEGYKHAIQALINSLENPKFLKKYIMGITETFNLYVLGCEINTSQCIDKIIKSFIPADYQKAVETKKSSIIREIIIESNKLFIKRLMEQYLSFVIDHHEDKDMIRTLQNEFIDILCIRRNTIYLRFVNTQLGTNKNPYLDLVYKLKDELKKLYDEKFALKRQITQLKKIIIANSTDRAEKDRRIQELENKVDALESRDAGPVAMPAYSPQLVRADAYYQAAPVTPPAMAAPAQAAPIPPPPALPAQAAPTPAVSTEDLELFDDSVSDAGSDGSLVDIAPFVPPPTEHDVAPEHVQAEIVSQQEKEMHKEIQAIEKKADDIFFGETNYDGWFE